MRHLEAGLRKLKGAGLTTNPGKYAFAKKETKDLGFK